MDGTRGEVSKTTHSGEHYCYTVLGCVGHSFNSNGHQNNGSTNANEQEKVPVTTTTQVGDQRGHVLQGGSAHAKCVHVTHHPLSTEKSHPSGKSSTSLRLET